MRAGHGRGYYGEGQLAQDSSQRRSGWSKLAFAVGSGAVIWLMWPRIRKLVSPGPGNVQVASLAPLPLMSQPAQVSEGYPGQRAYEDALVASALQLQASGAKVMLAPHLAHLAPRLGGTEDLPVQMTATDLPR